MKDGRITAIREDRRSSCFAGFSGMERIMGAEFRRKDDIELDGKRI